ncbi:hypothetical protein [Novosphingobium malaysiense]|uniref:Uncharacterized protein n=1 Tax=Novosphingobium malaysiense TaxID=1348853 RepID=A0A0B1ZNV1_9SPHN|nr:hypothetical protein [Novosphingobium malaysiense]KHK92256.1 hypothetical protein LK12_05235 [Novosphingobium malaysiense]
MESHPHSRGSLPRSGRPQFGLGSASALSMKWSALHDAASAVAALAGMTNGPLPPEVRNFPAIMRDAGGRRRELAEQNIEDLSAMMEAGLTALLSAFARGVDPRGGARALWREFLAARDATLALAPQGSSGPRRAA